MRRIRFYACYAFIFSVFVIASGCRCKNYNEPYITPPPTPVPISTGVFYAGVAKVDITPEDGVPLAGYGGRILSFPDLNPFNYHTYVKPSEDILDPEITLYARSLVLDDGSERVCIVTVDVVGSDGELWDLAHRKAAAKGFSIPKEKVLFCASHTHSGPGAMGKKRLWVFASADRCVNKIREEFTDKVSDSMVRAEQKLAPAKIGVGTASVGEVTVNRRAGISTLTRTDVDKQLGIIRIDKADNTILATVWNFAIHPTTYSDDNLKYSPDNVGIVSDYVEKTIGGYALFINGSEGDAGPLGSADDIKDKLGSAIIQTRESIVPQTWLELKTAHEVVNFGTPMIDASSARVQTITSGELDFLETMEANGISVGATVTLSDKWIEHEFRFQAIRIGGKTLLTSVPGEPIFSIGQKIKQDAVSMGYETVFICSLANDHMGYITTREEYDLCGYEGFATFFGPDTGKKVTDASRRIAEAVKP